MMFFYFLAEVFIGIFALNIDNDSSAVQRCKSPDVFDSSFKEIMLRKKVSILLLFVLFLLSSFQAFDWFWACSSKSGFKSIIGQDPSGTLGFLCFANILVAISCIVYIVKKTLSIKNDKESITQKLQKRIKNVDIFNNSLTNLENKYGKAGGIMRISSNDTVLTNAIICFNETKNLFFLGNFIPYSNISSCIYSSKAIHSTTTKNVAKTVTKSSNGSTLGRALVGGVIAGPVGAIVGGVTSKKESVTTTEPITEDVIVGMEHSITLNLKDGRKITKQIYDKGSYTVDKNKLVSLEPKKFVRKVSLTISEAIREDHMISDGDKHNQIEEVKLESKIKHTYICKLCGYSTKETVKPNKCTICGHKEFKEEA